MEVLLIIKKELELVKFNLTPSMSFELIRFNKLKKELNSLKELYTLDKNDELLLQIRQKEQELNDSRNSFIREFRLNNQDEIVKYLQIKDQENWSFFHEKKEMEKFYRIIYMRIKRYSSFVESV